jgi:deoxyribodipyrimidine photo-lyase
MSTVPDNRIRVLHDQEVNAGGDYVIYWMIANRRLNWNFSLQQAVEMANEQGVGIVIFEPLRAGYKWASDRMHRFILDGMHDNIRQCDHPGARYISYVERQHGDGSGLLACLANRACAIVTDDYPAFFIRNMLPKVADRFGVRFEAVDSNGIHPLAAAERSFPRAFSIRKYLHRNFEDFYAAFPEAEPLDGLRTKDQPTIPQEVIQDWGLETEASLDPNAELESTIEIDHSIPPAPFRGGATAAHKRWREFLNEDLGRYDDGRNHPDDDRASGLSPYLHFGHISAHQIVAELLAEHDWSLSDTNKDRAGKNSGWWGLPDGPESFLDEVITWRELGYNHAYREDDYKSFTTIPDWAQETLADHANDTREHTYTLEELAQSQTHDELWNAAQSQLRNEGRMHNYLRMLWGKKVLQWTQSPEEAYERLVELNNRYAVDGRDPNSYSGILWVFGKFDRAWGPEREIFGKVRYMTSNSARKKLRLNKYVEKYGNGQGELL